MINKVLILKGLPASGKTTYALELMAKSPGKYIRVSKDETREMIYGKRWTKQGEPLVLAIRDEIIKLALKEKKDVIVDDTNLNPYHIKRINKIVGDKAEMEIVDFTQVSVEVCIERDKQRDRSVGERIIREMHLKYVKSADD
ncbi:MAG: Polynucleotide 5'-hydroxyl-kinase [Candidatus Amesbacteria bacterium GW2011_GWB1_47_19]|nr:MAG: Polynucleotide 5'-hydroxyl-kinase [Candidatus Amesbacteria bacterium GW2011_GWA1_44_24]KKU32087.1 MAG: Polynucleotide 5'-hydroxyl-kinase [Candidatus Amesbacteria bacterium GW2011_GWC1_46_24]KKU67771.1 MAG: Polynucleotide 5'-hydroxyl-kinase [Candidatus Amesbacteria bacterium GW2011_GWB1_47_19]HBC72368.1 hypothetical protein [Candidatus Amesbacteria bacterium]